MSTITCRDEKDFFDAMLELTRRGLIFKADFSSFTITLTGGF